MLFSSTSQEARQMLLNFRQRLEKRLAEVPCTYWQNCKELAVAYDIESWLTRRATVWANAEKNN